MEDGSAPIYSRGKQLFAGEITGEVIGAFFDVYNALQFGFLESAYAGAMEVELQRRGLSARREQLLHVHYLNRVVGVYRADFIVEGKVLLELKTTAKIGHPEKRQLLHYLRATNTRLGLVLNFGPEPSFLRVINT